MKLKAKLSVADRLNLAAFMKGFQGNADELDALEAQIEELMLTDEEKARVQESTTGNVTTWDDSMGFDRIFVFEENVLNQIKNKLKELDAQKQLTFGHRPLYKMFVKEVGVTLLKESDTDKPKPTKK